MARLLHPVIAYMRGVMDGSVPACEFVKQAVARHMDDMERAAERGLRFDRAAAIHALQWFNFLRHSKGEWAGQVFELSPWQMFIVWVVFGWKRADGLRRFRTVYIEVPRKNGKSTFAAGIGLLLLDGDGEPGSEVYAGANKRDQAKIVWSEAKRMVMASPDLSGRIRTLRDNMNVPATYSKFEPLGADTNSMDGLNAHGALIDELHAHKNSMMVDLLDTATGARRQPLIVEITTAGVDQSSVCYEHREYSRQVLAGTVQDDTWFGFITTIDEDDLKDERYFDEGVWAKANPNLGISVKIDDLRRKAERARHMPIALNAFLRLHLNVWTQQADRWIDLALWDENAGDEMAPDEMDEAMAGRTCYGGLDLGSVSDLTAWVMTFPDDDDPDELDLVARFWCPEARLTDSENRYREQYEAWAREGWLLTTPGDAVDYAAVKRQVLDDAQQFNLVDMNVDRLFQGYQTSMELADEGLDVIGMGQGFISMAAPMKELEGRLLRRKFRHHGNPVLRWMAGNMSVKQDPAGNYKPDKSTSQGKIDGIVALVMALDRAVRNQSEGDSYDDDEFMVL